MAHKQITVNGMLKDINDNFAMQDISPVQPYFVDTVNGNDLNSGRSWENAFATMGKALGLVETLGTIYFVGDVREELTGSNLVFDVKIIGAATKPHHPDVPASGYHPGAACWRPPISPTAATPLLKVRGRGWVFKNILFDCPVDAAAVKLETNSESGADEYSAGHASFIGCRFDAGAIGIEDNGGAGFVLVEDCDFRGLTDAAIKCTSTSNAMPLRWMIRGNTFMDNANHILMTLSRSVIQNNIFGKFTTEAINTIYVATQGEYNMVGPGNVFSGDVDTEEGYTGDSTDTWAGNFAMTVAGSAVTTGSTNTLPTT